jgi:hypothetical protein
MGSRSDESMIKRTLIERILAAIDLARMQRKFNNIISIG